MPEAASIHPSTDAARPAGGAFAEGLALHRRGERGAAERRYRAALAEAPDHFESLVCLADLLAGSGRGEEALELYRAASALRPDHAECRLNLGTTLYHLRRCDEALPHLRRAAALLPRVAEAHNNLGVALQELGRPEEALEHYRQALAIDPGFVDGYGNAGIALTELGRLDVAEQAFLRALALAPRRPALYYGLINVRRLAPGDPQLAAMLALAEDMTGFDDQARATLHFALGKALDDVGEHRRAFAHFVEGNARIRAHIDYDEAATLAALERIPAVFTAELLRDRQGQGHPSDVPVFIVGMPRSGTTLLEQILASHPQVHGAGERYDLDTIARGLHDAPGGFPDAVTALDAARLRALGLRYVEGVRALAPQAARIVDKMTWNFRFIGLVRLILPNARIIHCRRDPVDSCLSCFSKMFARDQPHTFDLGELGRYYRAYERLMAHWREVLPAGTMLEVDYESLVADFEAEVRRVVAFCGIPWNDACLAFHTTRRPVRTASAVQVRQPLFQTSAGRWRRYGDMARPLLAALGREE